MSNINLPLSLDRESCPRPHLKQNQWSGYAICRLETCSREIEVQAREYCLSPVIAVLRYVEHVVKKCQVHRRHRVCSIVRKHHGPEQNPSKTLMCTYKKVSTLVYLQNKFMDRVKIVPSNGVVIWVGRQLLKMLPQTRQPDIECRELNVLVLFPPIPCLKRQRVIGDVVITVWIDIQPK
jgi:hypothetical protein